LTETRDVLSELFRRAKEDGLAAVLELWHPDGVLHDMTLARVCTGKAQVTGYLTEYFAALSDLTYEPDRMFTAGSAGVVIWRGSTTVNAPFFGFPPTDRPLSLLGVDVFDVRDGLVVAESSWYGDAWLAARLTDDQALVSRLMPRTP
jgi:steroid delta-isomerase-like uncharacterized protein